MKKILILITSIIIPVLAYSQAVNQGEIYTLSKLSQEGVKVLSIPQATAAKEVGDTSFTIYSGTSLPFKTYLVHGDQYDNIFNPNPTGMYINGKHFTFFCGIEMTIRQNFQNVLDISEFEYLGKKYLMLINFREDCLGAGCRYRCYNVFDVTDKDRVTQVSFSSLFQGLDTFGEFNNDGILDFARIAPKAPKDLKQGEEIRHYLVTAYSMPRGRIRQLSNSKGHAYYLFVKGDSEAENFKVLQADWFFPVKDTSGHIAPNKSYFAPYISFDPLYKYLYNPDGVRIEKNRWSVHINDLSDLEAAQEYCRRMQNRKINDVYIMIDQYSGDIIFQIFVGNFISKTTALQYKERLSVKHKIRGSLRDLRNGY